MDFEKLLDLALSSIQSTLVNEGKAVSGLADQYKNDVDSKVELAASINLLHQTVRKRGKIVCCGVGKSFKIALKTVATLKSLLINSDLLHPTEALHGDLGLLDDKDCLVFFTASGNTPELLQLLPHISPSIPIVLLTCSRKSKLSQSHQVKSLLYAELPDHLKESKIHGIPAPTVSATLSLILADAVALSLAEIIEQDRFKRQKLFSMKHPGGSIGSDLSHLNDNFQRSLLLEKVDHDSYASLLSLNQVKAHFDNGMSTNSLESSPIQSDSEEFYPSPPDPKLSLAIRRAPPAQCHKVKYEEFRRWSELDLLKGLTLYSIILYEKNDTYFGVETSKLRDIYRVIKTHNPDWAGMSDYLKEFQRVELSTNYIL